MTLADPSHYASDVFGFLSSFWGEVVLAVGSVVFLVAVKSVVRPSGERAFRMDDFAIGPDLLVLSIVTLISYAAAQYKVEANAENPKHRDLATANVASSHQVNAGFLALCILVALFTVAIMMQRVGQYTPKERVKRQTEILERAGHEVNHEAMLDAPRFKLLFGIVVPVCIGVLLLIVAIKAAVH